MILIEILNACPAAIDFDVYQPHYPNASGYYRCVEDYCEQLETVCNERHHYKNLRIVRHQIVYAAAEAFTIAAGPKPVTAFLDMVLIVTLVRIVFVQHCAELH